MRRVVRVTEGAADQFSVKEVTDDCPGDSYTSFQVAAVDQPLAARPAEPKPAPKAAPEPNPGFGDLMGHGRLHQATASEMTLLSQLLLATAISSREELARLS